MARSHPTNPQISFRRAAGLKSELLISMTSNKATLINILHCTSFVPCPRVLRESLLASSPYHLAARFSASQADARKPRSTTSAVTQESCNSTLSQSLRVLLSPKLWSRVAHHHPVEASMRVRGRGPNGAMSRVSDVIKIRRYAMPMFPWFSAASFVWGAVVQKCCYPFSACGMSTDDLIEM